MPAADSASASGPRKCLLDGRTSYTDGPCPNQARARALVLRPNGGSTGAPATASMATLYLCKSFDGSRFWTRERCDPRSALIERMASVSALLTFDEQVKAARLQRAEVAELVDRASSAAPTASLSNGKAEACQGLNGWVAALDEEARQPQPAWKADQIREQRREARDRQFCVALLRTCM